MRSPERGWCKVKWWKAYCKELKIASRGFYFYIELIVALLVLMVLMMVVKPWPDGHQDEYLYNDMPQEVMDWYIDRDLNAGRIQESGEKEIKLKPGSFTLRNCQTGEETFYEFKETEVLTVPTYQKINSRTGRIGGLIYIMPDEISMLRVADKEGKVGATITVDDKGNVSYRYYNQGYETQQVKNSMYVLHTFDVEEVEAQMKLQNEITIGTVPRLNTRQAVVPVYVTLACCLMGIFIVCAYVFLDKQENVIKAFLVTPGTLHQYLTGKILLILTVNLISATLVTLPVMGLQPRYGLFYLLLIAASFLFTCLGLVAASFFPNMGKAFGSLYLLMIILMLPMLPYYAGSFDPKWIHYLPSYPVLMSFKQILQGQPEISYVLLTAGGCLLGGVGLQELAVLRFRRTICE